MRRSSRHTSKPEPSGSITSSSTRSKALRPASAQGVSCRRARLPYRTPPGERVRDGAVIDSSSSTRRTVRRPGCMEKACRAPRPKRPSRPRRGRIRTRSCRRGRRRGHSIPTPPDPEPDLSSSWPLRPEPWPESSLRVVAAVARAPTGVVVAGRSGLPGAARIRRVLGLVARAGDVLTGLRRRALDGRDRVARRSGLLSSWRLPSTPRRRAGS